VYFSRTWINPAAEIESIEQGECCDVSRIKTVWNKLAGASKVKIAEIFSNFRVAL
jgi:hypothetical protein